jgi:ribonuclease HI
VYCDGAWGNTRAGATTVLVSPSGIKLRYATRLQFTKEIDKYINSIAKYEVVLLGLHKQRAMGVQNCILKIDSKVIARQIEKECITRDTMLERYLALVRRMENYFRGFSIEHIERSKNTKVDELVKATARKTTLPPTYFSKHLKIHQ